jgi:hypothetical protein
MALNVLDFLYPLPLPIVYGPRPWKNSMYWLPLGLVVVNNPNRSQSKVRRNTAVKQSVDLYLNNGQSVEAMHALAWRVFIILRANNNTKEYSCA